MKGAVPAVLAVVGLLAATQLGGGGGSDGGRTTTSLGAGEIFLEPVASVGADPYTPSVATGLGPTTTTTAVPATTATSAGQAPSVGVQGVRGGQPGLYGGTRNNASCDKEQLVQFLEGDAAKAKAWADVQGIAPSEVRAFIGSLTPVTLSADTRVTNHGFRNGRATSHQSVLQAGSAVLVDDRGVPRARCFCGNPLLPPKPAAVQATYVGTAWPNFSPDAVKVVVPAEKPLDELVLTDGATGRTFARATGTDGGSDVDVRPGTSTSVATTTTTEVVSGPSGDIPEPNAFVAKDGTVSASSTLSDAYPVGAAIDGDPTTSWFSKGEADGSSSTYTWTGSADDLITLIRITGNGVNADPSVRSGHGFDSVTVRVLDEFGDADFEQKVDLAGTPDPTVEVRPGVKDRTIVLVFSGHEDPTRGGFAELEVGVTR